MAGSGIGAYGPGGSWISGSGDWMAKQTERVDKFRGEHPEWEIALVRSMGRYEAAKGSFDTELTIMSDPNLGSLMDRLEARYAPEGAEGQATPVAATGGEV